MKKISFLLASFIFVAEIFNSCKKDDPPTYLNPQTKLIDSPIDNGPVNGLKWWTASAGHDQMLELPR